MHQYCGNNRKRKKKKSSASYVLPVSINQCVGKDTKNKTTNHQIGARKQTWAAQFTKMRLSTGVVFFWFIFTHLGTERPNK